MKNRYIIVDDFYDDPDSIVQTFKNLPTGSNDYNWAGVMTRFNLFDDDIKNSISSLVGHIVDGATPLNGRVRFSTANDPYKQDIHFDPSPGVVWAGVIYLTPDNLVPDLHAAGTQFWKHKEKEFESAPMTAEEALSYGFKNFNDMLKFLETDGIDRTKWELKTSIPWKYNRLVLFRPWLYHSPGFAWGNSKDNCRTVQTFFLKHSD